MKGGTNYDTKSTGTLMTDTPIFCTGADSIGILVYRYFLIGTQRYQFRDFCSSLSSSFHTNVCQQSSCTSYNFERFLVSHDFFPTHNLKSMYSRKKIILFVFNICIFLSVVKGSAVWQRFVKVPGVGGICKECLKEVASKDGTSNLHKHLKDHHKELVVEKLSSSTVLKPKNKGLKMMSPTAADYHYHPYKKPSPTKVSIGSTPKSHQPQLQTSFFKQHLVNESDLVNRLTFFIEKCNLPTAIVESEGLEVLMAGVAPNFELPSKKKMKNIISAKYVSTSEKIKEKIAAVENISLTTDLWSDTMNTQSYLSLTCHFIDQKNFCSIDIGAFDLNDPHTAENLKSKLVTVTQEWGIKAENIVVVVSDNAKNITKAVKDAFGRSKHFGCVAHSLNLVVDNVIDQNKNIDEVIQKVKKIVSHFKHSQNDNDSLKSHTDLKLIQSCETRWNSVFYMLERCLKLIDFITPILLNNVKAPENLTAQDKQIMEEFVNILRPFESATKILSGEKYLTAGKVLPVISMTRYALDLTTPQTNLGKDLKSKISLLFEKRFEDIESDTRMVIATLLDPRFKKMYVKSPAAFDTAYNSIKAILESNKNDDDHDNSTANNSTENEKNDFWTYHRQLLLGSSQKNATNHMHDFDLYLKEAPIDLQMNPIEYWLSRPPSPLTKIALTYLSMIATSTPSERLFSKTGNLITAKRNRLKPDSVKSHVFLKSLERKYWNL